ncbi:MAG: Spore germination protein, partial [Haloplasmataceae bacterium]|nr:Spore germination protein [Haloplasmataceae bacterium]
MEKEQISKFQFFSLMLSYIITNDLMRDVYFDKHKNNTWILVISGIVFSLIIFYIYMFIYKNFQYKDFNEIINKLLGKFLTKILFIIYPIYFIFTAGVTLRDQTELIQ